MDFSKLTPEQFQIAEMVVAAATENNIDPNLLLAQAFRESGFRHIPNKTTDAFGVMQIRPGTAEQNKLGDITDLRANVYGGARLMRQYLDKYKSPEAALLAYHQGPGVADKYINSGGDLASVGAEGLDYVINIGENGGFGQPAKAGDGSKEVSPNNPFASGVPLADKAREISPPKDETTTELDDSSSPIIGAALGAGANALLPMLTDPQVSPRVDTGRAQEADIAAKDRLELARRTLANAAPQGAGSLEESFRQSQGEMERLRNEQRLAQERVKGLPRTVPAIEGSAPPDASAGATRSGRASGPKIEGDSGVRNWTIAEAGQQHQMPEAVLDTVTNKTKDSPTGGSALISKDLENLDKIKRLGMSDYGLTTTEGGVQLQLPPTTVAERQADEARVLQENQAELQQRTEEARVQQEAQARQLEQQRLSYEADLERLRQERAAAGQRQNVLAGQTRTVAPLQRALTAAETNAELARRKLGRAQEQPNVAGRVLERAGVGSSKIGALPRAVVGGAAGYLGVMSYQEALARAKAGDTSEAVLKALEAGSAAAAMVPPAGKALTKLKGLGAVSLGGLGLYELARRMLKGKSPE